MFDMYAQCEMVEGETAAFKPSPFLAISGCEDTQTHGI